MYPWRDASWAGAAAGLGLGPQVQPVRDSQQQMAMFVLKDFFFFSHLNKVSLQVSSHAGFEHPQQPAGMLRWVWGSSGCARSGCVLGASPAVQRWSTAVDPVYFGNSWAFGFLTGIWFTCVVTDRGGQGRGGPALCLGHSFGLGPSSLGNNSVFLTK